MLNLVITIILARLLSPREFGLIAMITVITGFSYVFAEMGFGPALIQKQNVRQEHLASVFLLNVACGILLMVIVMLGASIIADFYGEPMLVPLTIFISTSLFIDSLGIVQSTLMTKSLDFRTLSIVEIVAVGISGAIAIPMAYSGFGVWSLAFYSVTFSLSRTVFLWIFSSWRPTFYFKWASLKDLYRFSMYLLVKDVLHYWTRKIDNLLIGRFLGTVELGIYTRAYQFLLFPLNNIKTVITRVLFPSFSIVQKDKVIIKRLYLKAASVIALLVYPLMLGLFVTIVPFVMTVFGSKWTEMIPILQIFCLLALFQSVIFPQPIYMSQGRTGLLLKVSLLTNVNVILGIVIGLYWGIIGVAIGYAIASTINVYPVFFFAGRLVNITFLELLQTIRGVFLCAMAMASLTWVIGLVLPNYWPHWAYLAVQVPFGIIFYFFTIHVFKLRAYIEVISLVKEQWQKRFHTRLDTFQAIK